MSAGRRWPIDRKWYGSWGLVLGTMGLIGPGAIQARADIIELRGGGQIQGKVVPDAKNKDRVQVLLLQGRHPLSFQKGQIVRVIPKASPLDDYVLKRAKTADTAEAHYVLGYWCEQNRLVDLARLHYEQALSFDPDFESAHKKLGHTKVDGSWLTRDDLSAAQGLVKYKGRWVTAEDKAKREDADKLSEAQGSWLRRLRILRQALINGSADRRREAESQLMAIRDPEAVSPLVRTFGHDEVPRRILLSMILSTIAGPEATAALVQRVLDEPDSEVRSITFDQLKQRGDDHGASVRFIRALARQDINVLNRAAWALGNLNVVECVPQLVDVLITSEERIVVPPLFNNNPAPNVPGLPGLVPRSFGNYGMVYTTPPAASNGAVAMGLGVAPGFGLPPGYLGGNAVLPSKGQQDAHVETFTYRNIEVLGALQKLTGQDFGYDVETWRRWIARSFNPHPNPSRRVPQP
jgi:PBS lyase HEAT-like repeat